MIVRAATGMDISARIALLLAEGWVPQGGLCSNGSGALYQAMIRTQQPKPKQVRKKRVVQPKPVENKSEQ